MVIMDVLPVALAVMFLAGWFALRRPWADRRLPVPAMPGVLVWLVVAACSSVQLVWPVLGEWGGRDVAAIEGGQWWRLLTSMVLQDGGVLGTVFNLATLAISLWLLTPLLHGWQMPIGFLVTGLVGNLLTWWVLGADGAGNSLATIALMMTGVVLATRLARSDGPDLLVIRLAPLVLIAAATITSVTLGDNHWLAVLIGIVCGVLGLVCPQRAKRRAGDQVNAG